MELEWPEETRCEEELHGGSDALAVNPLNRKGFGLAGSLQPFL